MRAYEQIRWNDHVPLGMVEKKLVLDWHRPDAKRLEWANERRETLNGELPRSQQEIYAMEASILHEKPKAELKLQAIRIGELGIATLPNEGDIPPPEQHPLGGYTTWPARTAGLEVSAEPQILESLLGGLEDVAGKQREPAGVASTAYKGAGVVAHWPLDDLDGETARPNHGLTHAPLRIAGKVARYLPGVGSGSGCGEEETLTASTLSAGGNINRAMHLVDGYFETDLKLPSDFTVALWYWLGERSGASAREGSMVRLPSGQTPTVRQGADHRSQLSIGDVDGRSSEPVDEWNLAVLVKQKGRIRVYLSGGAKPDLEAEAGNSKNTVPIRFGEGLEGKLDEIALWDRALDVAEQQRLWRHSGIADKRAKRAAARRQAEKEAAERADPPEWPDSTRP